MATGDGKFRTGLEGTRARRRFRLCLQLLHRWPIPTD
jgi:hypothetical protein